ncbi:ABC transporter ATP-binding protein [Rhizobium sp. CG5]|uniref:ABC transporter ATP-binding protein n=1 Tax=Rhizobium sp. CG5 TaxID=2726076 RepID=UPI0020346934|nr:ABC transporter ATP-binding protein [Rhizobium sp. CG5]MCM2476370.1 ABC transporter ATP-binding protein [Rhizobium sp. CG5]
MNEDPILHLEDLQIALHANGEEYPAIDGVNLQIGRGEVVGLVGESGCGKSLCALSVAGLLDGPLRVSGGRILFDGGDIARLPNRSMRMLRGSRIAMIFQEPMTALNPLMTIGDQIGEMFVLHRGMSRRAARRQAIEALEQVQVPAASRRVDDYPHQLSGGMRQRVMIAIALACDPDLLIADEATTALDVTIQAEIVELILDLCRARGTAVLMISHDLGLVARVCNRVAVMYAGHLVEEQPADRIFSSPQHPYTQGLVASLPRLGRRLVVGQAKLADIPGVVPQILDYGKGCRFAPRCAQAMDRCSTTAPGTTLLASGGKKRCYLNG